MKALVLEKKNELSMRDITIDERLGERDVRIKIAACGICGSDVHYFTEGRIGDFVVDSPMVLGHEAAGVVVEVGAAVTTLAVGDRVCMEPGIPRFSSRQSLEGNYNLDKDVVFWATPPVHGVMRESVVHPESFTFALPQNVSFHEGAMVEPCAIGIEAAKKARIQPGDVALVVGAVPIGIMIALAALSSGCSTVLISDIVEEKLAIAASYKGVVAIHARKESLEEKVLQHTRGRGVDVLFEASGSVAAYEDMFRCCRRGGRAVLVGMMNERAPLNVPLLQVLGLSLETVFRYTNCFERALSLIASGAVDLERLITKTFAFEESIAAYNFAAEGRADTVKVMIDF